MDLTSKFLSFALLGAEWVLWLLVFLSIVSVAVMIERWRYFSSHRVDFEGLVKDVRQNREGAVDKYGRMTAIEAVVAVTGLKAAERGSEAAADAMVSARTQKRQEMEKNLAFLGTLGNNAPFIGLFGTVLGIIRAFRDLADNSETGARAVMAGISEALVATAVGLLVALPAVVTYNYFVRRVRGQVANADTVAHEILSQLKGKA
jgi:biopolymer transport protein ExbB